MIGEYFLCCAVAVPMSPANLSVTSVTWESVELTWTPGNDGGRHQVFIVSFIANAKSPDMEHIPAELTTNSSTYNITGISYDFLNSFRCRFCQLNAKRHGIL